MFENVRSGSRFSTMETWDVVGVIATFLAFLVQTGGITSVYGTDLTTIGNYTLNIGSFSVDFALPLYLAVGGIVLIIVTNTITANKSKEVKDYFNIQLAEGIAAVSVLVGTLLFAMDVSFLATNVVGSLVAGMGVTVVATLASIIAATYPY